MPANGDRPTKTAPPSDSRRQAQTRSQGAGTKTVTALSNEELTKAFLIHPSGQLLLRRGGYASAARGHQGQSSGQH